MPSDAAELSSIATALRELEMRVTSIAERHEGTKREDLLAALYETERQLRGVVRSVERAAKLAP